MTTHQAYFFRFVPRARTAEIATAAVQANSTIDDSVIRAKVKLSCNISRTFLLPFPAPYNNYDGTHQITRWVRSAMSDTLVRCDNRETEGVRALAWVTGWTHRLHLAFKQAYHNARPTNDRSHEQLDRRRFWTRVEIYGRRSIES